jgi:hypothetical protein
MRIFTDINISKERGAYQLCSILQALFWRKECHTLSLTPFSCQTGRAKIAKQAVGTCAGKMPAGRLLKKGADWPKRLEDACPTIKRQ